MSIPHEHAPDHCDACRVADLKVQVAALRAAAEVAWVVISGEPNVSARARARAMARLQEALKWGVFGELEEERG